MSRTKIAIPATAETHALRITDVREADYDYVSIGMDDQAVIVSRDQLPVLIRALWKIRATEAAQ